MWDNLIAKIIVAGAVPFIGATWYGLDATGYRWATKNEVQAVRMEIAMQGVNETRQRLIDRKKDGVISDYEKGILAGICAAQVPPIPPAKCDKEDDQ